MYPGHSIHLLFNVSHLFYQFNWSLETTASPEVNAILALARSKLSTALEAKLSTFPSAIIDVHGKDLTVSADPSRTGTPVPATANATAPVATSSTSSAVANSAPSKPKAKPNVNSATVIVEADFRVSAADLYSLLTDEKRIPTWTRAPAQVRFHMF